MSHNTALDALYLELLPHRISTPDPGRMADGPTARWAEIEARRAAWALALEVGDEELPSEAGAA